MAIHDRALRPVGPASAAPGAGTRQHHGWGQVVQLVRDLVQADALANPHRVAPTVTGQYATSVVVGSFRCELMRARDLSVDAIEELKRRDSAPLLVLPDVLDAAQDSGLVREGIPFMDKRRILHAAWDHGHAERALAVLGTMPGGEQALALSRMLATIEPGRAEWQRFQSFCVDVLRYLFVPPLNPPKVERANASGGNRPDVILPNYSREGFWEYVRNCYKADLIVADAKNYTEPVGKDEVLQVANYLSSHGTGHFGLIIARRGGNSGADEARRRHWGHDQKMITILDDADITAMLTAKAAGREPTDVLLPKLENIRLDV